MASTEEHMERALRLLSEKRDDIPIDYYQIRSEIECALHHYRVEKEKKDEKL
jgi:hypothetical protein